jgi:phosphatidylglycerol---prolipoprotein diacylglyceryl transferase
MLDLFQQSFHLYGLMIGLGVVVALEVSLRLARIRYISEKLVRGLFWWVIGFGVLGARIYHVVDYWGRFYRDDLIQVLYVWNGGLGIWGGVLGGVVGLIIYYWIKKPGKLIDLFDVAFAGLPLAQTIGRLGNFFNQELYGKETDLPWGLLINGKNYHPLFAYEGVLNLILFGVLWKLRNRQSGTITGGYLVGYGLIRLALEGLRPEEIIWKIGGIPMAIIWSMGAIFLGGMVICRRR